MMKAVFRASRRIVALALTLLAALAGHVEAGPAQLSLAWADTSSNEIGFSIERSIGAGDNYEEIGTTSAGVTKYVDTTIVVGTTYCYRVRAYTTDSYSDYSNEACATTVDAASLAVVKAGATGAGTVISNPPGIICGATCSASYGGGAMVTLTATPAQGSVFAGWSGGGCSGAGTCAVTLASPTVVTATFSAQTGGAGVTVTKVGAGSGTVMSAAGINCGTTCTINVASGASVKLAAQPALGSVFAGWSGGCTGTGVCIVTATTAVTLTASFDLKPVTLSVAKLGAGAGTVTTTQAGIECGPTCKESYASGTTVTLTAAAQAGSVFKGWSGGGCSGTGTCTLTLDSSTRVTATFRPSS
jgi:hypothetical protein